MMDNILKTNPKSKIMFLFKLFIMYLISLFYMVIEAVENVRTFPVQLHLKTTQKLIY